MCQNQSSFVWELQALLWNILLERKSCCNTFFTISIYCPVVAVTHPVKKHQRFVLVRPFQNAEIQPLEHQCESPSQVNTQQHHPNMLHKKATPDNTMAESLLTGEKLSGVTKAEILEALCVKGTILNTRKRKGLGLGDIIYLWTIPQSFVHWGFCSVLAARRRWRRTNQNHRWRRTDQIRITGLTFCIFCTFCILLNTGQLGTIWI